MSVEDTRRPPFPFETELNSSMVNYGSIRMQSRPLINSGNVIPRIHRWTQGFPVYKLGIKCLLAALTLGFITLFVVSTTVSFWNWTGNTWTIFRDHPNSLGRQSKVALSSDNGFNEQAAKELLVFAGVAYESNENDFFTCMPSFTVDKWLVAYDQNKAEIRGFTGMHNKGFIVVAVEGTQTNPQLYSQWQYLDPVSFSDYDDVYVVEYWYTISEQMLADVVSSLTSLVASCSSCPVYFTGHSLGAATVTIMLTTIFERGLLSFPTYPHIYTFGQPRVGNKKFSELAVSYFTQYRIVNQRDPIPHVPCCNTQLQTNGKLACVDTDEWSPWHTYREIYYEFSNASYIECDGEGEDINCSDGLLYYSLSDHYYYYDVRVSQMCDYLNGKLSVSDFYVGENHRTLNDIMYGSSCLTLS